MEKSKDDKLQALVKQQTERARILKILLQPKPIEELTPKQQKEVLKIKEAFDKVKPFSEKPKKTYRNEYDQNAHSIIHLAMLLTQEQFSQLPDVDSETVYYIIKRMVEVEQYNFEWKLKMEQLKPSATKSINTTNKWQPYQKRFNELINKGITESKAIYTIQDEIEAINRKYMDEGKEMPFKTRKSPKTDKYNPRPNRSTLYRQLVRKSK